MSGREKGKISIKTALQQRDAALYHRLENIWTAIAREIQERQQSKEGHQQGPLHCGMVEDNLGKLIPDDQKSNFFTPLELFLFSAAACYHDIGKSIESKKKHGEIAMDEMLDRAKKYGLTDPEGLVLSYIVGSHDSEEVFNEVPENYHVANEDVRVRLLSSLLRLADILHSDNSRIPHTHVGDTKKEDEKTRFRKLIPGWGFDKNSQIELTAVPENYNDLNIIQNGVSMMQKEIECIAPVLHDAGYPYKISIHCDDRKLIRKIEEKIRPDLLEMDYYTEKEASIFRGRKNESQELLDKVFRSKVSGNYTTLLIGNSGVGKTSLIRAGLFPILINMGWKCIWTRPLNPDPLKNIFEDLNNASMIESFGSDDIFSCIKNLSDNCAGTGVLISIDQFEDILRSQPHEREEIGKILRRIYSKSFRNVHVLLSYRGDYEPDIFSFLESASITRSEKYSLHGFDKSVASDVLRNLFLDNNIGIDDVLLVKILNEIDKKSEIGGIYPPFIQIVASNLINFAESNDGIMTEELYEKKVGSVENIIGAYLINLLDEFGDIKSKKRINAEEILKELVKGKAKEQKGKDELLRYLNISVDELHEMLDTLVSKRLIRHLGNNNYEIIHDYLASRVEEMIKNEERPLRGARDILRTKAQHYRYMPTPSLLEPNEVVLLYSMKESIKPDIQEKELLMFSYLAGNGPVWWWFKDDDESTYRNIFMKAHYSHFSKVRVAAVKVFEKLGTRDDLIEIEKMLMDPYPEVRTATVKVFEKLGIQDDLRMIEKMLLDPDSIVRTTAEKVFEKFGVQNDRKLNKSVYPYPKIELAFKEGASDFILGKNQFGETFGRIEQDDKTVVSSIYFYGGFSTAALSTFGNKAAIIKMLKDPFPEGRKKAITEFEKIATHNDVAIIKEMLRDSDSYVRYVATNMFEKLLINDDIMIIREMIKDTDSYVRYVAVSALEKLGSHNDMEIIKYMLRDPDSKIRKKCIQLFSKFGKERDLQELVVEYANGKIVTKESLKSIILLDEKFYSPSK